MRRVNFFVCCLLLSFEANAFDWKTCENLVLNKWFDPNGGPAFYSTTQYSSSWGPCSMTGDAEKYKPELFYVVNYKEIESDAAKGNGDHLSAFLKLYQCQENPDIRTTIKQNYSNLFVLNNSYESFKLIIPLIQARCALKRN